MNQQQKQLISEAMKKAFNLGSLYWQQADSEYVSQHKKADETVKRYHALIHQTLLDVDARCDEQ
jgi:hypothetical protein